MRDPKRIPKVLEALRKEWEKYPDQRLGQLLDNVMSRNHRVPVSSDSHVANPRLSALRLTEDTTWLKWLTPTVIDTKGE